MGSPNSSDPWRPPYYAVIFTSRRTDADPEGYRQTAWRGWKNWPASSRDFLASNRHAGADGTGITVSYWQSREAISAWKQHVEHLSAQATGRKGWYARYQVRIARVEADYAL